MANFDVASLFGVASPKSQQHVKSMLLWQGSKYRLLLFLYEHIPVKQTFVDVFGGSGVVVQNMQGPKTRVYNDAHSGLCDFFRALRDYPKELQHRLYNTPYAREEWERAYDYCHRGAPPEVTLVERACL